MWIGSSWKNQTKPFGIKWPSEPIKALGVFYTYDPKLLHEKNFIEKLDTIKKLVNMWSARGLSLYGKVTIIKSLIIPKFIYIPSLLPTPKEIIKVLNQLLYKFLWKGVDKVTRLSTINEYEKGGLKMVDGKSGSNNGAWKNYLQHLLERVGGLFLFNCSYDIKDYSFSSQFYTELLQWWLEFREEFASGNDRSYIIWNNREIRINKMPVFYKKFFESDIVYINDLLFDLNNIDSFEMISIKVKRTNLLTWAGLRHAIPPHLKKNDRASSSHPKLMIDKKIFDVLEKRSKDCFNLFIKIKAEFPNKSKTLKNEFNLTDAQLEQLFILPHTVAFEPYLKAFQYKILNSILYTNTKLYKLGFISDDRCSICKLEPETMSHLFFHCRHSFLFWKKFESYFFSSTKEFYLLSMQDVLLGIISSNCPSLNYLLLVGRHIYGIPM